MKLEMAILAGDESKSFLAGLTKQIDRLEKAVQSLKSVKPTAVEPDEEEAEEDDDEDFSAKPAKTGKKAAADFDDDEEETVEADEDAESEEAEEDVETDDDEEEAPPAPAKATRGRKPKKVTVDDVNDACKARARAGGKNGRAEVLAILKKKFKTESVSELEEDQWQPCIDAMMVKQ